MRAEVRDKGQKKPRAATIVRESLEEMYQGVEGKQISQAIQKAKQHHQKNLSCDPGTHCKPPGESVEGGVQFGHLLGRVQEQLREICRGQANALSGQVAVACDAATNLEIEMRGNSFYAKQKQAPHQPKIIISTLLEDKVRPVHAQSQRVHRLRANQRNRHNK